MPHRPQNIWRDTAKARLSWLLWLMLFAFASVSALGCQPRRPPQRELFEEADQAYRVGHYDKALERYESFLKNNPDHQLAPLAQQRILSIERELEIVMGRKNGPRPIYLRPVVGRDDGAPSLESRAP